MRTVLQRGIDPFKRALDWPWEGPVLPTVRMQGGELRLDPLGLC